MLLCLGSVVWTVASEAHWLVQAETKRQMVVVCVVYCDCDLTALLYLLLEVCVCGCVCVCSCVHAYTSKCICVMKEEEIQRLYVHNHQFTDSRSGSCWWISSQSKQESKHTDGMQLFHYHCWVSTTASFLFLSEHRWKYCSKADFKHSF